MIIITISDEDMLIIGLINVVFMIFIVCNCDTIIQFIIDLAY